MRTKAQQNTIHKALTILENEATYKSTKPTLCNPDTVRNYLLLKTSHYEKEVFSVVFLDNNNTVLEIDEMFTGTVNSASVYPREIVKRALEHNAAAIILAHNHPSGSVEPSQADIAVTQRIKTAMELIEIRVLDHFIIGGATTTSFAERGLL